MRRTGCESGQFGEADEGFGKLICVKDLYGPHDKRKNEVKIDDRSLKILTYFR